MTLHRGCGLLLALCALCLGVTHICYLYGDDLKLLSWQVHVPKLLSRATNTQPSRELQPNLTLVQALAACPEESPMLLASMLIGPGALDKAEPGDKDGQLTYPQGPRPLLTRWSSSVHSTTERNISNTGCISHIQFCSARGLTWSLCHQPGWRHHGQSH